MMEEKIALSMDRVAFDRKPTDDEAAQIHSRLQPTEMTVAALARCVVSPHGRTFTPAVFDGGRSNANWRNQQLVVLDIDGAIALDDLLARLQNVRFTGSIEPAFAYTTFSSVERERYRVVFCLSESIRDHRLILAILNLFAVLVPESDAKSRDEAHMFYPGKEIIYENCDARVGGDDLVNSVLLHLKATTGSNYARAVKKVFAECGVDVIGGVPYAAVEADENATATSIYIKEMEANSSTPDLPRLQWFEGYTIEHARAGIIPDPKKKLVGDRGEAGGQVAKTSRTKRSRRDVVRRVDYDDLTARCGLLRRFVSGEEWLYYPQLFGLLTNLVHLEGGREMFLSGLKSREDYAPYYDQWVRRGDLLLNLKQYQPESFAKFYPEGERETGAKNLVIAARLKWGDIRVLEPIQPKPIEEIRSRQREIIAEVTTGRDPGVDVLIIPTGSGKTEACIGVKEVIIAAPTNTLKNQIAGRWRAQGHEVIVTPDLPTSDLPPLIQSELNKLYRMGANRRAMQYLRKLADEHRQVRDYLEGLDAVSSPGSRTIITTHQRALGLAQRLDRTLIFDEDPTNVLLKQGQVKVRDVKKFLNAAEKDWLLPKGTIATMRAMLRTSESGGLLEMPKVFVEEIDEVEAIAVTEDATTNVLGFLRCSAFIRDGSTLFFVGRRLVPSDRKIIVLSATADPVIGRKLYGDNARFHSVGHAEMQGRLLQYPQWSMSNRGMRDHPESVIVSRAIVGGAGVITSKTNETMYENVVGTFGSQVGLDHLGGQDLGVCGTYHLNPKAYFLMGHALGFDVDPENMSMRVMTVGRNGYEFRFHSFEDEGLRNLQLHLVESELVQAVGRARLVNHDCTVTVFSNYPVPGAEFRYLSKGEIKSLVGE